MDLTLDDEQLMLAQSARALVERSCPSSSVRALEDSDLGFSPEHWRLLADLDFTGLLVPEEFGGTGQGVLAMAVLAEALGRGPLPSPLHTSSVVATDLLLSAGDEAQQKTWLPRLAAGDALATLALVEPTSVDEWSRLRTTVEGGILEGTKILVPYAGCADLLVVAAQAAAGPALVLVDPLADGVSVRRLKDGSGEAVYEIVLRGVQVGAQDLLGEPGSAGPALQHALDRAAVVALAAAVGGAQRALELSLEHAGTRRQFGQPIGAFQAVAHRCVDMLTDIEASRLLCHQAAWRLDAGEDAAFAVAAAKAYGTGAMQRVFTHAHQVHGAIGFSMEHDLQLYARRAKAFQLTWGSAAHHRERVAQTMGLTAPEPGTDTSTAPHRDEEKT